MGNAVTPLRQFRDAALCGLLALNAAPDAAADAQGALGGSVAVGSEYVFRGISQTMEAPAIQAYLELDTGSGFYAYAWGSNVDFVPDGEPDDGARYEVDLAIGYASDVDDSWSIDVALVRYLFPGTASDVDYDYNELIASVGYDETYTATFAYSGDVDGTGAESLSYELGAGFALPADLALTVNLGHVDLSDAYGASYSYSEATLARALGNATVMLTHVDTYGSADFIYDHRLAGRRYVLTLQFDW